MVDVYSAGTVRHLVFNLVGVGDGDHCVGACPFGGEFRRAFRRGGLHPDVVPDGVWVRSDGRLRGRQAGVDFLEVILDFVHVG